MICLMVVLVCVLGLLCLFSFPAGCLSDFVWFLCLICLLFLPFDSCGFVDVITWVLLHVGGLWVYCLCVAFLLFCLLVGLFWFA